MNSVDAAKLVEELIKVISAEWLVALFHIILAGSAFIILKNWIESLAFYLMFRVNRYLKEGTLVEYKGMVCRINDFTITAITLKCKKGYISIPMKCWKKTDWIVLKDKPIDKKEQQLNGD